MMTLTLFLVSNFCGASSAQDEESVMPVRVAGPWSIEVGPGTMVSGGAKLTLQSPARLAVAPPERIDVCDEKHEALPVFNPKVGGWQRGARLRRLITQECSATGLLYPDSVRVKSAPGDAEAFQPGVDYDMDPFWATVGRTEGGSIGAEQAVYIDYAYSPDRLDSVFMDQQARVSLAQGESGVGVVLPPEEKPGVVRLLNVWAPGRLDRLTAQQLFPCDLGGPPELRRGKAVAETLLPNTLAKLRSGEPVTIVAWGDSVTNGGGVNNERPLWYQHQFRARLEERFPQAHIDLRTAAWGGGNSRGYMQAPAGGPYDYQRDVLDPKPDLVTIEFVNDAYLDVPGTKKHYAKILEDLRGIGAEVVLITPHLVRPDWMKSDTLKIAEDPRPYVAGLREFAAENQVALADASKEWCKLHRMGIPYTTLLANSINHPDVRGHALFARVLMDLFPAR